MHAQNQRHRLISFIAKQTFFFFIPFVHTLAELYVYCCHYYHYYCGCCGCTITGMCHWSCDYWLIVGRLVGATDKNNYQWFWMTAGMFRVAKTVIMSKNKPCGRRLISLLGCKSNKPRLMMPRHQSTKLWYDFNLNAKDVLWWSRPSNFITSHHQSIPQSIPL